MMGNCPEPDNSAPQLQETAWGEELEREVLQKPLGRSLLEKI